MGTQSHITILGAGPAGLGAAYKLAQNRKATVTVIDQNETVGGISGSFQISGLTVDYGSHRLHPACDPEILKDIKILLGDELLDRPRHGRIRLCNRWIHFPLKPVDLALKLPLSFLAGTAVDLFRKTMNKKQIILDSETFASVLEVGLGRTICREFYFPYAYKIWGLPPDELSPIQARRRVSAGSLAKMLRKVLTGGKSSSGTKGCFFYPRGGFGQIASAIATAAEEAGAEIRLETTIRAIRLGPPHSIELEQNGQVTSIQADQVWSTIPINILLSLVQPKAPDEVQKASSRLRSRAMVLIYLVLGQSRFSEYDAHYFPEPETRLTRLSEPKNYSARTDPSDRTVLCSELPCDVDDEIWQMSDEALADVVRQSLDQYELPIDAPILSVTTRRLAHAYPIYRCGYEECFRVIDQWLSGLDGVLSFGRQGLLAHNNIHHTLAMAYAAVDCLNEEGKFDKDKWQGYYRKIFETHVVED
ncbi:MAG: protoporphyrinogen/coproporphyrinogen oxidase [Candidatus Hodarchaeota archaeon]